MTPSADYNNPHLPNNNNPWSQTQPNDDDDGQFRPISSYLGHAQREHVPSRGVRGVKKQSNLQSSTLPRKAKFREQHQQQQQPHSVVRKYL